MALWITSYFREAALDWQKGSLSHHTIECGSYHGDLLFEYTWGGSVNFPGGGPGFFSMWRVPQETFQECLDTFKITSHFGFAGFYERQIDPVEQETGIFLPYWAIAVVTLIPSLMWLHGRRKIPGTCQTCGYDLRATPDRCPECGTVPPKREIISN